LLDDTLKLELSAHPRLCCLVRRFTGQVFELAGFDEDSVRSLVLAVDEAFTNVIRHTYRMDFAGKITLIASFRENSHAEIRLIDQGPPIDPRSLKGRDLEEVQPGGLGLHFIRNTMDEVEFTPLPDGNALRLFKRCKPG
jgi:anti-sigma regulatory factor (Ser/Thr protein kinase)